MAKKRRTELDIDTSMAPPPEEEAEPAPVEEPSPADEEKRGEPEPERKINYLKLSIIIGLVVLVVALMGAIGFILLSKSSTEPEQEIKKEKPAPIKKPAPRKPVKRHVKIPELYQFSPFLIRVGKGEREALVQLDFAVEMSGVAVRKEIDRNLVLIRENIYFLLNSLSLETFTDKKKRRKMAVDVAIILNRSIQSGAVTKTLITGLTIF
ncbi:hypothetical protein MNBD_NITROSPINAE02-260 [hydrothermal vent metagenome]|uniref:Flagellar protein FliL n=1 Tax=hydrothermal vent metagenome TaxID=652676 RepID=A0A3B1CJX1_9ZZZZ